MISSRTIAFSVFLLTSMPTTAFADDVEKCIAANETSVELQRNGKLLESRIKNAECATEACPQAIQRACVARADELNAAIPSVIFEVRDAQGHDIASVTIAVDGQAPQPLPAQALSLNPGAHRFRFEAPGSQPSEPTFVLRAGERQRRERVVLSANISKAAPTKGPEPATGLATETSPPRAEGGSSRSTQKTLGLVAGGVGIAGLAVGGVFFGIATRQWDEAKTQCGSGCSVDSPAETKKADAESNATVATVSFVAGGVLLVGGVLLFLTAPRASTTGSVRSVLGVRGAGLAGSF